MPTIITQPDRLRKSKREEERQVDDRHFYEKEIEANRQVPLPCDVEGYSKKAPMPAVSGSGSRPYSNTEGRRLRDEWNYGVTRYLP